MIKAKLTTELLKKALKQVKPVINKKAVIPILTNYNIHLYKGKMVIVGTDLENTIVTQFIASSNEDIYTFLIDADLFTKVIDSIKDELIELHIDNNILSVVTSNGNYDISILSDTNEYPNIPKIDKDKNVSIKTPIANLLEGIDKTLFATGNDELRPVLTGVLLDLSENGSEYMVSTDAHKLSKQRILLDYTNISDESLKQIILNRKSLSALKNLFKFNDIDEVNMSFDNRNTSIKLGNTVLISRNIEGEYPNYKAVIPNEYIYTVKINRLYLIDVVKRVSIFTSEITNLIKLTIDNDKLVVSANNDEYGSKANEKLDLLESNVDNEMSIGFNGNFLIDLLSHLTTETISIDIVAPNKAILFKDVYNDMPAEQSLMLLMPLMLD